ncbi:MAG TPA: hypothetical protein VFK50_05845 [Sphingomicrobium sp.]|nr:hypothetical protein [Sphingomicrobium sp.]
MSIAVALLVFASAQGAAPAVSPKPNFEDPVVCRRSKLPEVGTRMKPKPVCQRKSDWAMFDKQNENELRQINQRGNNPGKAESR